MGTSIGLNFKNIFILRKKKQNTLIEENKLKKSKI